MRGLPTAGRCAWPGLLFGAFRRYRRRARKAAAAPLCAPHKGRAGDPPPYAIPVSVWRGRIGRTPVRSVVKRQAAPGPWTSSGAGAACINAETRPAVRGAACKNTGTRPAVRGAAE